MLAVIFLIFLYGIDYLRGSKYCDRRQMTIQSVEKIPSFDWDCDVKYSGTFMHTEVLGQSDSLLYLMYSNLNGS